jgi:hypothetical protein
MSEFVMDRIAGYPLKGWENDTYVPFLDMDTGTRRYPLNVTPAPLEWDIWLNVDSANAQENAQERSAWVQYFPVSTASGGYFMQGACDPNATDPTSWAYYPNCTDANNDVSTGGVVQPTPTNQGLQAKSGDLSVYFKALFESKQDALLFGAYFHNSGAGSYVNYPGNIRDGTSGPYVSIGCDWMNQTNPYSPVSDPLATAEEIARCHPAGTNVTQREYNPMERAFCRDAALSPQAVQFYGPYRSNGNGIILVTVTKAVFDRL